MFSKPFRDFEHDGWERVAGKYEGAWSALTKQFIDPLLTAANLLPGMRVLDVACGPGYVASAAKARGADVVGIDFAREMVIQATKKNPGIRFFEGDAEQLDFRDGDFDRVLMNFGVLHFAHPEKAFAEAGRVLRPGGRLGFTVWARPEQNPGIKIMSDSIEKYADMNIALPEGPPVFRFSDPTECANALKTSAFLPETITINLIRVRWLVPTADHFFVAERDAGVRTAGLLAAQSPERLSAIRSAVAKAVQSYSTSGGFAIPMAGHIVTAKVQ